MHSFLRDSGFDRCCIGKCNDIIHKVFGKISCGFFAERFGRKKGFNLLFHWVYLRFNSSDDSAGTKDALFIWFGLGIFGTGLVASMIQQLLSADLFGLRSLGKITD